MKREKETLTGRIEVEVKLTHTHIHTYTYKQTHTHAGNLYFNRKAKLNEI